MQINNLEELFIYASEVISQEVAYQPIEFLDGNYNISVHIDGENWDKKIDARMAKYIINLQKSLDSCLDEFDLNNEKFILKVDTEDGSNISKADIFGFLSRVMTPMTDKQTFITIALMIAGLTGYYITNRYLSKQELEISSNENIILAQIQAQRDLAFISALQSKAESEPDVFAKYEKPLHSLIRSLDPDDLISVSEKVFMDAEQAKKMGPPRMPRNPEETSYADGVYILERQTDSLGEVIYELSSDDIEVKGYISGMDQNDIESFMQEIHNRRLTEELPIKIDLQINIVHIKNKIKKGIIQGLGAPRPNKNHKTLQEIINQ